MDDSNEQELVEGLRRGDESAYRELVRLYQHRVFTIVLRLVGDREEAVDVAQDVFVTVFRSAASFRGDSLLSTWLYRVAVNRARNHLKYMRRRKMGLRIAWDAKPGWEPPASPGARYPTAGRTDRPDESAQQREMAGRAVAALGKVDDDFREALVLHEVEGLPYEEVAAILGVPPGTVKSRIHRARAALRRILVAQGAIEEDESL